MKSDVQFGKLFQENPDMLSDLLGQESEKAIVASVTFKDVIRSADLCWFPQDRDEIRVVEIQGYHDKFIWHRGEIMRTCASIRYPDKKLILVTLFLDPSFDPRTEPWRTHLETGESYYEVLYLEKQLKALALKQPDHVLLSVLAPLYLVDEDELRKDARFHHKALSEANLDREAKTSLLEVFESLLMARFKKQNKEELFKMLAILGDLKESVAYQEIFAEGEAKGEAKGKAEGKAEGEAKGIRDQLQMLETLLKDGVVDTKRFQNLSKPLWTRLQELENFEGRSA